MCHRVVVLLTEYVPLVACVYSPTSQTLSLPSCPVTLEERRAFGVFTVEDSLCSSLSFGKHTQAALLVWSLVTRLFAVTSAKSLLPTVSTVPHCPCSPVTAGGASGQHWVLPRFRSSVHNFSKKEHHVSDRLADGRYYVERDQSQYGSWGPGDWQGTRKCSNRRRTVCRREAWPAVWDASCLKSLLSKR